MSERLLGDRYRLEDVLGRGGMATVWRAWDRRLERPVAVKILGLAGPSGDSSVAQRFEREARTVARLAHPNIVAVLDVGAETDVAYFVMELVDGVSVAALLASGPLPVERAVAIAGQTCDALESAHAAGIIHRDIKPANILVTSSGGVKVCDFGIARHLHAAAQTLTAPGTAVGTIDYMAPEQILGDAVDVRTDLYALGCVLYAMLTGGPPFPADGPVGAVYQHLHQVPAPLRTRRPEVPAGLEDLVGRLLAKDPSERPADAHQVHDALAQLSGPLISGRPTMPVTTGPPTRVTVLDPTQELSVHRPGQDLADSQDLADGQAPGQRRPASRTVVLAALIATLMIAGVLAVALFSHPGTSRQTPPHPQASLQPATASPAPADSRTPTVTLTPSPPADPTSQLAALKSAVQQQVQDGQLDPHAADNLGHQLDDLGRSLANGHPNEVIDKINALRDKLTQLRQDSKITEVGYNTLTAALDRLTVSLPTGTGRDN